MSALSEYRVQWLGNIRGDVLAGLVVALALIPEAIAFSVIAGVDPKVGLYASFSIAVHHRHRRRPARHDLGRNRCHGGADGDLGARSRPAVLAARPRSGRLIQICRRAMRLGDVMRFVSKSVMTGFVNALAILIFLAQLPELIDVTWLTYVMVAGGLAHHLLCSALSPRRSPPR